ncbi:MAG: beta-lactamase domain protein [Chloroflexi bacterium]|nr:beta-lactamase domain protein [Chloroflexota bacterium]
MEAPGGDLRVKSLASGSSANAMLIECASAAILVDAGLSARQLQALMRQHASFQAPLAGILITHEHTDHTIGADVLARQTGAALVATPGTLSAMRLGARVDRRPLASGSAMTLGPFEIRAFPVPHDATEPVGYHITCGRWRVGVATDLGHCSRHVHEALHDTDLTVIEANHDRGRLAANRDYSTLLKRRIAGDRGHLANEQTAELLQELSSAEHDRWVWLAHLSEENNRPSIALAAMHRHFTLIRRTMPFELKVAERDRPSVEWDTRALFRQRALF